MAVSKTIDDIFSSEVDEKEVNALIGSLETKLAPQNPKAVSGPLQDSIVSVNHVNESATLPAQTGHVGLTTVKAEPGGSIHSNAVRQTMQESQLGGAKTGHNHESGSSSILQANNGTEDNDQSNHGVSGTAVGNVKSDTGTHLSPSSGPTPVVPNPQVAVTNPPTAVTLGIGQQDTTQAIQAQHQQTLPGNTKQNDSAGGMPVSALNPNALNQLRTTSGNDQQIVKVVSVPSAVHSHNANAKLSTDAGGNVNNSSSAKDQLQARQQALAGSASSDQSGAMKPRIVVQPSMATVPTVPTTIPTGSVAVGNANQKVVTINVASPGIPTTGRSGQYVVNAVSGTPKAVSPQVIAAQTVRMPTGQHVIAPRAQMGAPVQIRLPPGTSLPPGVVLINKGGTVQAVMSNPAAIQAHVAGSPGITYRHVQPGSQIVTSNAQPGRVLSSGSATTIVNSPQIITQTTRAGSPVVISSNVPVVRGITSTAVSVSPQVSAKTSVTVMGKSQNSSAAATTASSGASGSHGAMSPGAMDNVKKCKNFLTTLIRLASNANQPPQTVMNVKKLVQNLIDAKIEPEEFTQKLQKELNSSPQPYLVPFLKRSLPLLRQSMQRSHSSSNISSLMTPIPANPVATPTATSSADTAASSSSSPASSKVAKAVGVAKSASLGTTSTPSTTSTTVTTSRSSSSKQSQQASQKQPSSKSSKSSSSSGQSPSPQGKPGVSKPATPSSAKSSSKSSSRSSGSKTGTSKSSSSRSTSSKKDKSKDSSATFSSSRDDDDINDVASMAGVNLSEESARILATNEAFVGTQLRSCEDEKFLHLSPLRAHMSKICTKHGVDSAAPAVLDLVSQAVQERLKQVVEKLSVISQHRLEIYRNDARYQVMNDVRSQMKFFEQLDTLERKRRDEQEREILLRAAKSRSKQEDPEQLRLKQKAREMQQMELEQLRQQEANLTALAAIGPRKKRKLDSPTPHSSPVSRMGPVCLLAYLSQRFK
ncbi:transcription initiation factor TFIID subunit 4B-like isoform X1 [Diadema setosum]|uniref:transcription initiation factor TFIID subunit 4B-like isoform X1 n=1 Tax=Diadema setosum TaxID=31175 RepID=UPI003B3B9508